MESFPDFTMMMNRVFVKASTIQGEPYQLPFNRTAAKQCQNTKFEFGSNESCTVVRNAERTAILKKDDMKDAFLTVSYLSNTE